LAPTFGIFGGDVEADHLDRARRLRFERARKTDDNTHDLAADRDPTHGECEQ